MKRKDHKNSLISLPMILFEFRKTIGNPYVHIFGVGMPILMMIIITRAVVGGMTEGTVLADVCTSVFLGIGAAQGQFGVICRKAVMICLECIGIG